MVDGLASVGRIVADPAQLLERQLEEASAFVGPKTRLVSVTVPVPPGKFSNLLEVWTDRPVFALGESVGLGAAAELRLDRLDAHRARQWAEDLLAPEHLGGLTVPPVFCGAAFAAQSTGRGRWSEFPAFGLTLPRWQYSQDTGRAELTLTMPAADLTARPKRDEAVTELGQLLARLGKPGQAPSAASPVTDLPPADWQRLVSTAIDEIRSGRFRKLVLARAATVEAVSPSRPWSPGDVYSRLLEEKLHAFAVRFGSATLLGATPETLVAGGRGKFTTHAIAGTALPGHDDELLGSPKNREEHRLVVEEIERRLAPFAMGSLATPEPSPLRIRDLVHLVTRFSGPLKDGAHLLDLACALHPTPAVGGLPGVEAVEWICANEPEPRGWYAGFVGLFDRLGSGSFLVAIRSGLISEREACLYTGAGIVAGSNPADEYEETAWKQRPFLRALGLETGLEAGVER